MRNRLLLAGHPVLVLPAKYFFMLLFCVLFLAMMIMFPDTSLPLVRESILIWYQSLLPTLFPAMILSNIVLYIFFHQRQNDVKLYNLLVILLGFFCGFPIGAYLCSKLVKEQQISPAAGQYLLGFCNNLSPVYLLGIYCRIFPGVPPLTAALIFYGCPLLYGWAGHMMRRRIPGAKNDAALAVPAEPPARNHHSIIDLVDYGITDAVSSIVRLAGYIIFFRLFLLPLNLLQAGENVSQFLGKLIEITSGILKYSHYAGAQNTSVTLMATLPFMTFGGLCCIGQTICMIKDSGLSVFIYIRDKVLQSLLVALVIFLL